MNQIAEDYVKLVLALGKHDDAYVDAYYGPEEWKPSETQPIEQLLTTASALLERVAAQPEAPAGSIEHARSIYMQKQLVALKTHATVLLSKTHLSFDEEAVLMYDAHPPHKDESEFTALIQALDAKLPRGTGNESLMERYSAFRNQFVIPKDRLDAVFQCAIAEAKRQTLRWIKLPEGENFVVEYVEGKPWSGYNWFKGGYFSVIQVNTDLPIYIDRAFDLAAHEGYPGHHVYNSLLEQKLYRERGWVEYCVYPLFSPQSLIAEGTANFGIEMVFPNIDDRIAFEAEHLFPLAGLDPAQARAYYEVEAAVHGLGYATNEAARNFLDGKASLDDTVAYMVAHMSAPERARKSISFFSAYRSYIINYSVGMDMVRDYINRRGIERKASEGDAADLQKIRWEVFADLLCKPWMPSMLL